MHYRCPNETAGHTDICGNTVFILSQLTVLCLSYHNFFQLSTTFCLLLLSFSNPPPNKLSRTRTNTCSRLAECSSDIFSQHNYNLEINRKFLSNQHIRNIFRKTLKCLWIIAPTKRHTIEFSQTIGKCSFFFIFFRQLLVWPATLLLR